ncbi:MAG: hypothetical protein K9M56_02195 [Victivallales bacterium]|nr:hypothetical protein [Victivallales bacterium]
MSVSIKNRCTEKSYDDTRLLRLSFHNRRFSTAYSGLKIKAFYTTAAGDRFIGAYACFSALGFNDNKAAERACKAASVSVQRPGLRKSFPLASELPELQSI